MVEDRMTGHQAQVNVARQRQLDKAPKTMQGKSFGLLDANNKIRKFCWGLSHYEPFNLFVLSIILVNCVLLTLDDASLDSNSKTANIIYIVDLVSIVIFSLEMMIKLIGFGVYQQRGSYFQNGWNRLDALVVVTGIVSFASPQAKALNILKALRPIRIMARSENIKVN